MIKNKKTLRNLHTIKDKYRDKGISDLDEYRDIDKGDLFNFFFTISNSIKSNSKKIKDLMLGIFGVASNISTFNVKLFHISNNIEKVSLSVQDASESTLATMEQISASTQQISSSMNEYVENLEDISSESRELMNTIYENDKSLNEIVEINENVYNHSITMEKDMDTLLKVLEEIKKITTGIESIADQTQLLSLNANIEAARAGENGRGFAVVAGEIGKLATTTKEQLSIMQDMVENIEQASNKSKDSVSYTRNSVEELNDRTNILSKSFNKSKSSVDHVLENVESISAFMEELTASVDEISSAMEATTIDAQGLNVMANTLYLNSKKINSLGKDVENIDTQVDRLTKVSGEISKDYTFSLDSEDYINIFNDAIEKHKAWVDTLELMVRDMRIVPLQTNDKRCAFGHVYHSLSPRDPEVKVIWEKIDDVHHRLHKIGDKVMEAINNNDKINAQNHVKEAQNISEVIIGYFDEIINMEEGNKIAVS